MVIWNVEGKKGMDYSTIDAFVEALRDAARHIPHRLVLVGSARDREPFPHDIDLELYFDGKCRCEEFVQAIEHLTPPLPVDIFCKNCGAVIHWRDGNWIYSWKRGEAKLVRSWKPGMRGITFEHFGKLEERVERLERLCASAGGGCPAHHAIGNINIDTYKVNKVRVKKIELLDGPMVKVTLEAEGKEYSFIGEYLEVIPNLENILRHWKYNVIPRRLAQEAIKKEEMLEKIKSLEGMEV